MAVAQEPNSHGAEVRTLKDFFNGALQNSEKIAISEQAIREAQALYRQTLGESLPEFSYRRQTSLEDNSDASHDGVFRVTKTDLTGFRELAALQSGRSTVNQRQYQRQRAEQLLLQDVAGAFYGLLLAKENVSATKRLIELAQKRLEELRERVRVGRTREADAIGQEFFITSLQSQLEESVRQVSSRANLLSFLAGIEINDPERITDTPIISQYNPLEDYLMKIDIRPDVQAARENMNAAKGLLRVARSQYFPDLGITANSYTDRSTSGDDERWDVLLTVNVPLWDWKGRQAAVDAADSVLNQKEKEWQALIRQSRLEVRNAYLDHVSAQKQLELNEKRVKLARKDYEIQVEDDQRGVITNLEVFESLGRLNNVELSLNNARLQEKLAAINLEIVSGGKPDEILK